MAKNLTMKPFSNFNSATVHDTATLREALEFLRTEIADSLFRMIGKIFHLAERDRWLVSGPARQR